MKYQSSNTKTIYNIDFDETSNRQYKCPECSNSRKKSKKKDLKYYQDTKTAYCFHCLTTLFEYKPYETKKQYKAPEWKNITKVSDKLVKYFIGRMISQNTLNKMRVYSDTEWMPQFEKEIEVICFPYFRDKTLVNIKFRGWKKSFKLSSGAELLWYNFDSLRNNKEIIICEGEIDALTWIENGYDNVISVPNGAGNSLEYLDNSIDLFNEIEKVYLSTDVDNKGIELRDELIRRLGAEKCYLINFKQYKDANDYFVNYGGLEFKELLKDSKQAPVKGVINIDDLYNDIVDLYENGEQPGKSIDNMELDNIVTWELSRLVIVTGIPGSGKSEFVDYLVIKLNLLYKWKAAYFTPENYPLKYHYRKLHSKLSGRKFETSNHAEDGHIFFNIYEFIKENYYYIMDENDMTVESVVKSAIHLIKQKGIKILVIDPYNKLEHQYKTSMSETQYISIFLDKLTNLAKFYNILVILVAHPRKMPKNEIPSLYDISGSANFYNKTDYGITVDRERDTETGLMTNEVNVYIQKVKFKHLGSQGIANFKYNYNNGRFEHLNDVNNFDNSNWLQKDEFSEIQDLEPNEDFKEKTPF